MPGLVPGMTTDKEIRARSARAALRDWQDTIAAGGLCNGPGRCHIAPTGVSLARTQPPDFLCASRAADPYSVAGAYRLPRHRPLCLFAGAAGHARRAGLVLFRRG